MSKLTRPNPLPRQLAPNIHWLGECLLIPYQGIQHHQYASLYLVRGSHGSLLVEAGLPGHVPEVLRQLELLLPDDGELKYIWPTHQETPHAGGVAELMARYPSAKLVGDVRDYHLYFPELEGRLDYRACGDVIDLGDTQFRIVEAVIQDLVTTQWGYDAASRSLFTGDGFAYSHFHDEDQCGRVAEETPMLPITDLVKLLGELALYWWQFHDLEPHIQRISEMIEELDVEMILPSHGLPITDCKATVPLVLEGFRRGSGRIGTDVFG